LPAWRKRGSGVIVNVWSVNGRVPKTFLTRDQACLGEKI